MKTINKKAFTIVELVIVISIIGILAAVLIPTFGNLIEKANEANDTSFVKNINTMLIVGEVESGKPDTFTEMKNVLAENGINIEKIKDTNTKDYKYAWNYSTNRMILMDDKFNIVEPSGDKGEITNKYDYYVIVKSEEEMNKYDGFGYYLLDGFTKTSDVLQVKSGLDTGNNEGLSVKVASNDAFTAFVNTNKGVKLVVDAENATINHFGTVTELEIIKVAQASYHEYGLVDFATISAGRIEVMKDGKVSGLKATGTSKVDMQDGAVIGAIEAEGTVALNDKAEANKLSEEEKTFANLFKRPGLDGKSFKGYGTESSPFIISSMQDWKDMVSEQSKRGIYKESVENSVVSSTVTFFTKKKSYEWKSLNENKIFGHWKVTCDLDFSNESEILGIQTLYGTIDFDGHTVKGFKRSNSYNTQINGGLIIYLTKEIFQNGTVYTKIDGSSNMVSEGEPVEFKGVIKNLIFENVTDKSGFSTVCTHVTGGTIESVTTYGTIESFDNNAAPFAYAFNSGSLKNCINRTNVSGYGGMISAFIGKINLHNATISFENCDNYGNIINIAATIENYASVLLSNYINLETADLTVTNCKNYGNISSVYERNSNLVAKGFNFEGIENSVTPNGQKGQCISVGVINSLENQNGSYVFNEVSDAVKYKLIVEFTYIEKGVGTVHGTAAYLANVTNNDKLNAYEWINYEEGMTLSNVQVGDLTLHTTEKDGNTYYVFKYEYNNKLCTTNSIRIQYTAIGTNGNPIAVYTTTVNCK